MAKAILAALILAAIYYLFFKPRPKPQVRHRAKPMPQDEARAVLGVAADADEAAIRSAHRRLASALHPDKGGSEELTQRINAARDTLLRRSD